MEDKTKDEHVHRLQYEDKEILLIATAHVSRHSAEEVRRVIEEEKPDSICIELDEGRYKSLKEKDKWRNTDLIQVIKDKKAALIQKQLTDKLAQNPTLEGLAATMGTEVKTAPAVNFASFQFGDAGMEPYIIGKASVAPEGKVSVPLKGESGVYVIVPLTKQADTTPFDPKMESMQLDYRTAQSLPYMLMQKMREKYKIVDNRSNFY